ncbi:alpha/beta hydrolase [Herbaspirillum sp. 3R11]|nr:alpha/beta hydrolase [Herbaspirillum sp. 3R-3a1]TFI09126.1 alpha/beta hydrolase [Herbaspirillum sp. 3R11]TFI15544.1 alpha/beta hydrolase [Herbaspirillum sp. 3R-11]TFI30362.1 alpha/beta hydrolase [Herbaspirillum sp. 3C11]
MAAALAHDPAFRHGRFVDTDAGRVHLTDSAPGDDDRPCIVFTPDGPNVVAHYQHLVALLAPHFRVVCFDMPGFGFSLPAANYTHSLDQGARVVLAVLDQLQIGRATLAFSCANGLYAIRAAQLAPTRIASLMLTQTPALAAMQAWAYRMIPRPLRVPVAGQLITWLARRKLAQLWYRSALPANTDAGAFQETARRSFDAGGCFCLAGVVQGLLREASLASLPNVPCTLIWGDLDRSHRDTSPESLRDCLPRAEIVQFGDCGHFPDLEQPERYARQIVAHMEKFPAHGVAS